MSETQSLSGGWGWTAPGRHTPTGSQEHCSDTSFSSKGGALALSPDSAPVQPGGPAQVSRSLGVSRSPQSEGVGPDEKSLTFAPPGDPLHISAPTELHAWKDLCLPNKLHELRNFFKTRQQITFDSINY